MEKRIGIEGSPGSKLKQVISKYGHNRDIKIEVATVISPYPSLTVQLSLDGIELGADDLIVTQSVLDAAPESGDMVLVICDEDAQRYFLIDKVV